MAVDRDSGFAFVEAHAVYFRLPQTYSPIHVDKSPLKTCWTSTGTADGPWCWPCAYQLSWLVPLDQDD
jgi:hypothetical protein